MGTPRVRVLGRDDRLEAGRRYVDASGRLTGHLVREEGGYFTDPERGIQYTEGGGARLVTYSPLVLVLPGSGDEWLSSGETPASVGRSCGRVLNTRGQVVDTPPDTAINWLEVCAWLPADAATAQSGKVIPTRRQPVPGEYGDVVVRDDGSVMMQPVESLADLDEALMLLAQVREAWAEGEGS